jgi:hypothetical protein
LKRPALVVVVVVVVVEDELSDRLLEPGIFGV